MDVQNLILAVSKFNPILQRKQTINLISSPKMPLSYLAQNLPLL